MKKRFITNEKKEFGKWTGYLEGRKVIHMGGEKWIYAKTRQPINPENVRLQSTHIRNWNALGVAA